MSQPSSSPAPAPNSSPENLSHLLPPHIDSTIQSWLDDDMPSFDVGGMVVGSSETSAQLYMKSNGVLAGKPFADAIFRKVGCVIQWNDVAIEGKTYDASSQNKILLGIVTGPVNALLRAERTALNTLSRCSGVATASAEAVSVAKEAGWKGFVAGTRKTTPGFRIVEKYALLVGGAATHRLDLSQMVMLKDNHIWSAGSITRAVQCAKRATGFSQKIEVECQTLEEALEAASAGADIVMLDNMEPQRLKESAKAFKERFSHVIVEASGGITIDTMKEYFSEHVDVISQGSLTQGYKALDFSLKIVH